MYAQCVAEGSELRGDEDGHDPPHPGGDQGQMRNPSCRGNGLNLEEDEGGQGNEEKAPEQERSCAEGVRSGEDRNVEQSNEHNDQFDKNASKPIEQYDEHFNQFVKNAGETA